MVEIELQGKRNGIALVDDSFKHLLKYKWRINVRGYVHTNLPRNGAKIQAQLTLHKAVFGSVKKGNMIDHINHNKLDNRLINLREVTPSQNQCNKLISKVNKSGYKGVFPSRNKFRAAIWLNGKSVKLGTFLTAEEAHEAYYARALIEFKEYACK